MSSPESRRSGLPQFFAALGVLVLLNVGLGYLPLPGDAVVFVEVLVGIVFIALPILGLFRAADHPWTPRLAGTFIVLGLALHLGLGALARGGALGVGLAPAIALALSQAGLVLWSAGLGALLATILKDKNLLLPVSLFLAAFDLFLVLTPMGFTQKLMQAQPELLPSIGFAIPKIQENPAYGPVAATAYVGPADLLFMGMFFVALFRFQMRAAETFRWLIPTLLVYMGIVLFAGPLPALVPIGLCILIVNWKEFKLNREEWVSTGIVAAIGAAIVIWGATQQPARPAGPSPQAIVPGYPAPPGSLGPRAEGPPR